MHNLTSHTHSLIHSLKIQSFSFSQISGSQQRKRSSQDPSASKPEITNSYEVLYMNQNHMKSYTWTKIIWSFIHEPNSYEVLFINWIHIEYYSYSEFTSSLIDKLNSVFIHWILIKCCCHKLKFQSQSLFIIKGYSKKCIHEIMVLWGFTPYILYQYVS